MIFIKDAAIQNFQIFYDEESPLKSASFIFRLWLMANIFCVCG